MTLLLALLLQAPIPRACSLAEPATAAGLLLAESHWVAALEARDVSALDCRLTAGFADTDWRGRLVTKEAVLSALPRRDPTRLRLSELKAQVMGRLGLVRGVNTQIGPAGQVVGKVRFTDLFVRGNGGWRALAAQETLIRDGEN